MSPKLLVPLDGTTESAAALPFARTLAREGGLDIALVRVIAPPHANSTESDLNDATDYLERVASELERDGQSADSAVRQSDDPAMAILADARDQEADLVVMTTHGRSGLGRAILGSVATRVVENAHVPVVLLRPGERRVAKIQKLL
ncbi:MAG TPA: universal stress protein, partial [Chloroflexota bacterium]|nr:universal stress protein [Chloroflexota bacterium]